MKRRSLQGAVVAITGASAGIGRECAMAFAREGARVAVCARRLERLEALAEAVRATGAEILIMEVDGLEAGLDRDKLLQHQARKAVVLEFKDYETALACYNSPEYARLVAIRSPHSEGELVIVEGYDGPQPSE